ncbi:MAG: DNA/RNA non-specific endonuclease [Caldisericia bacterium]
MRRTHLLNVLVTILLVAGLLGAASSSTTVRLWIGNASMSVNGVQQPIDAQGTKPVIIAGRTLVPIRAVIEAFGGSAAWESSTRKVTVTLGKSSLDLWIDKSQASLNGIALAIDAANSAVVPVITNGRTMLPLRFVAESLGIDVQYADATKMITLTYPKPTLALPADGSNLFLGNPSNAVHDSSTSPDNYLMDSGQYVLSYNRDRATPNWVSWYIGTSSLGSMSRENDFRADTSLPAGWYQVQASSYSGSGFDRGHNCPSADRTSTVAANSSTFLMTNMIPQAPNNNQRTWDNFENYLRSLVKQGNEVYVVMGSYGKGGTGSKTYQTTIDGGHVTVPAYTWKVAVVLADGDKDLSRITTSTRVIAIDTPNTNGVNSKWQTYLTSVDVIEAATGYDLLSNVSVSIQKVLEAKVDGN